MSKCHINQDDGVVRILQIRKFNMVSYGNIPNKPNSRIRGDFTEIINNILDFGMIGSNSISNQSEWNGQLLKNINI